MDRQFYKEELGNMIAENAKLKQQVLDLTDGLEVGSPEDYEDDGQLDLFNVSK